MVRLQKKILRMLNHGTDLEEATMKLGKYSEALKAYDEAEKKGFHQMSVYLRKSKTFSMMGNSKEAMDSFQASSGSRIQ